MGNFSEEVDRWVALRTAARREKDTAELLAGAGVPVFLPLMSRLTTYRKSRRVAEVPVFSGYVFAGEAGFADSARIGPHLRSRVAQVLRPPEPERLRDELRAIAALLTDRELVQERLVGGVGDVVRIVGGPLTGYQGPIVRTKPNRWVVVLEVSFLGAHREVEVDVREVERVGLPRPAAP